MSHSHNLQSDGNQVSPALALRPRKRFEQYHATAHRFFQTHDLEFVKETLWETFNKMISDDDFIEHTDETGRSNMTYCFQGLINFLDNESDLYFETQELKEEVRQQKAAFATLSSTQALQSLKTDVARLKTEKKALQVEMLGAKVSRTKIRFQLACLLLINRVTDKAARIKQTVRGWFTWPKAGN